MNVEAMNRLLFDAVPFARVLGARIAAIGPEEAEAVLPAAHERLNHVGTVHAVAQFGLAEVATGALVLAALGPLQAEGYAPVAASAQIRYRRPGRGELRAVAHFARDQQQGVRDEVQSEGHSRFTIPVALYDVEGTLVSEGQIEWVVLQPRTE